MCDYTAFLPDVTGIIVPVDRTPSSLENGEIKALVRVAFLSTIRKFATDTRTLRKHIQVSLFRDVVFYPLTGPKNYLIHEIESIAEVKAKAPLGTTIGRNTITLKDCPPEDVNNAWNVEVSVIPGLAVCEVEDDYCARYFEAILNGIIYRLTGHKSQTYFDANLHDRALGRYNEEVRQAERESVNYLADTTGVGIFLPSVMTALTLTKTPHRLRERELMAMVTVAFKTAVTEFMRLTDLYTHEIHINVFKETPYYPLTPPDGFTIKQVVELHSNNMAVPKDVKITIDALTFACCPIRNQPAALVAEVSLLPSEDSCVFDSKFLVRHKAAILAGIRAELTLAGGKVFGGLGEHVALKRIFEAKAQAAVRDSIRLSSNLKTRRISDV